MTNPHADDAKPDQPDAVHRAKRSLVGRVLLYTAARLLLVAMLAGAILGIAKVVGVEIPVIVAMVVAVILQLPLSHLMLGGLRSRLTADMEVVGSQRRADKEQLRAQLRGEGTAP